MNDPLIEECTVLEAVKEHAYDAYVRMRDAGVEPEEAYDIVVQLVANVVSVIAEDSELEADVWNQLPIALVAQSADEEYPTNEAEIY